MKQKNKRPPQQVQKHQEDKEEVEKDANDCDNNIKNNSKPAVEMGYILLEGCKSHVITGDETIVRLEEKWMDIDLIRTTTRTLAMDNKDNVECESISTREQEAVEQDNDSFQHCAATTTALCQRCHVTLDATIASTASAAYVPNRDLTTRTQELLQLDLETVPFFDGNIQNLSSVSSSGSSRNRRCTIVIATTILFTNSVQTRQRGLVDSVIIGR
jgi:hypothetical protein